tara:strand:- start:47 stop:157 length:111 start_codon:yes stop_codon:yes gene_type:complete
MLFPVSKSPETRLAELEQRVLLLESKVLATSSSKKK